MSPALFVVPAAVYLAGVVAVQRRGGWWPFVRTVCWVAGWAVAATAVTGPIAATAHHGATAHMAGHLLLGMLAPLLLALGAPVTLALRALPVRRARSVSRVLAGWPLRILTHPLTAAVLDAGGLWLLYTTDLHEAAASLPWLNVLVQVHILGAGYLFTASIIGRDPAPHRPGRLARAAVLVAFLAAHSILAKYLYAEVGAAAEVMYYGGDLIDLAVVVVFCHQWYRATGPDRRSRPAAVREVRRWRLPEEMRDG
ncbi:cytochrome c oxidase assembly protein [Actinoplanes sp. TFC3]|uniref:cytochrome c oxidase assembly protein n=1 Tax=Actinoplanes sp. TFC3 TaxID=1710355 RepID=UPI00082DE495|nr:cytochrome c oxidase assembly protein [Actinoplanes sp. TFC3]